MKSKLYYRAILLLTGLLFWVAYLCQKEMARYGIYTLFSYSVHAALSFVPYLGLIGAAVWLIALLVRGRRAFDWKFRLPFAVLLALLLAAQTVYLVGQSQLRTMTTLATVLESDPLKRELVIQSGDRQITLECPMLVQEMVELEEQTYQIVYEFRVDAPDEGRLCMIKRA